jgi:hypothetical protein
MSFLNPSGASRALALLSVFALVAAAPASAQRIPFERTLSIPADAVLDVITQRGAIDVSTGPAGQVIVRGTATVRLGFNVPANAPDLARQVAAHPPITQDGATLRLRPPTTEEEQRAVTLSYRVIVPPGTQVRSETDSGATSIARVAGPVTVTSQSGAVDLDSLGGGAVLVKGSSGAVRIAGVAGDLDVRTQSGGLTLSGLGGGLRLRTQSGAVDVRFTTDARGACDVETGSSGITIAGVRGGLSVVTNSGHVRVSGRPVAPWTVGVGSSSIELAIEQGVPFQLDASSGSGDVYVTGRTLDGASSRKGSITGTLGGGGPLVRASTRSGSVRVALR